MVDDRRREARHVRGNVTQGGRYGGAESDSPHVEPEVPPLSSEDATVRIPDALAGALRENEGVEEPAKEARPDREPA